MKTSRRLAFLLLIASAGCTSMREVRITPGPDEAPPRPPVMRFSELHTRLRLLDDRVEVRAGDRKVKGTLVELSDGSLVVRLKKNVLVRFACDEIDQVVRMGDSVDEGATVGGLLAAIPAWNACQNKGRNLPCVAGGIALYGGIGALIDMLIGGPTVVYIRRPQACQTAPEA